MSVNAGRRLEADVRHVTFQLADSLFCEHESCPVLSQAQKHNSPLMALDFSEDSNYVQSASEDNELLYRERYRTSVCRWLSESLSRPGVFSFFTVPYVRFR